MYSKLKSLRKVNALTNISKSTISRWVNNIYYVKNKKINKLTPVIIDSIKITLKLHPFFSVNEIQNHIKNTFNINCSTNLIRVIMKTQMKLTKIY